MNTMNTKIIFYYALDIIMLLNFNSDNQNEKKSSIVYVT